ncbi:hypothetical protein CKAN_02489900 [Cinnamomum micranthum f. kanehirae]|uniref:Uncharacterized protein n=1 Tax=Cinnamomum micranthum f. kanehirae TaxID=337451 RepID=A0A3S3NNE7_9MAGN|nr:hypothetical protein CKAN_02489900 [Cinnamomum micranthum f. kanehirae]
MIFSRPSLPRRVSRARAFSRLLPPTSFQTPRPL